MGWTRWGSVAGLAGLLLVGGCTGAEPSESSQTKPDLAGTPGPSGGLFATLPEVADTVRPLVVTIVTTDGGLGSGVVYRDGGVIVTNHHVVEGVTDVAVRLADGSQVAGEVVATDRVTDLAVVRAERDDLPPIRIQPDLPRPGELVAAVGSPLGFESSVTAGVVSGLGRELPGSARRTRSLVDLIQTDAAISPGNSGGALVNARGELVGINEAYLPPKTGAVSIGFAIPAATVTDTVDELLRTGKASHAHLGVTTGRLTDQLREALGIRARAGTVILDVTADGPADQAGLRRGDVITRIGDADIDSVEGLLGALRRYDPGDTAEIGVNRGGRTVIAEVRFGQLR